MSNIDSLYLKHRPKALDEMVGNRTLVDSLFALFADKSSMPHAILLTGPSGCGKTTIARIIKSVLKCSDIDFKEIDSADFRGIDTVRDMLRQMMLKPMSGKCRVWLLDECFSKGTRINTLNGFVSIENINRGDVVFNLEGSSKVKNVFKNKVELNRIVKLIFSNGLIIYTTKQHEFLTSKGWVKAENLKFDIDIFSKIPYMLDINFIRRLKNEYKKMQILWERISDIFMGKENLLLKKLWAKIKAKYESINQYIKNARDKRLSNKLQIRYSLSKFKNRNRGRWEIASVEKEYIKRCKKSKEVGRVRLESIEIYKQGNNDESFRGIIEDKERNQNYAEFYDLEMMGHPSYFVGELPVHNCHKLSLDAQPALLKALEDTPQHVYFILATTDPHKLIPTIRNRCMTFSVQSLSERQMMKLLNVIVDKEGKIGKVNNEIVQLIARESLGSPRAALVMLQKIIDLDNKQQAMAVEKAAAEENQTIDLCRALISKASWKRVREILKGLQEQEPESVRRAVLGYCNSVLLNEDSPKAWLVMDSFRYNTYDTGWSAITMSCYEILGKE